MINFTINQLQEETINFLTLNGLTFIGTHDVMHVLSGMPVNQTGEFYQDMFENMLEGDVDAESVYESVDTIYADYKLNVSIDSIESYIKEFSSLISMITIEGVPLLKGGKDLLKLVTV